MDEDKSKQTQNPEDLKPAETQNNAISENSENKSKPEAENEKGSNEKSAAQTRLPLKGKRLAVLISMIIAALLSLFCALLYLSTLPRPELTALAGYYQLSQASKGDTALSGKELGLTVDLQLGSNGWCSLELEEKGHLGRWKIENEAVNIRCPGLRLTCTADGTVLRIENLLDKGLDIVLEKN